jgi:hypothetical protein
VLVVSCSAQLLETSSEVVCDNMVLLALLDFPRERKRILKSLFWESDSPSHFRSRVSLLSLKSVRTCAALKAAS